MNIWRRVRTSRVCKSILIILFTASLLVGSFMGQNVYQNRKYLTRTARRTAKYDIDQEYASSEKLNSALQTSITAYKFYYRVKNLFDWENEEPELVSLQDSSEIYALDDLVAKSGKEEIYTNLLQKYINDADSNTNWYSDFLDALQQYSYMAASYDNILNIAGNVFISSGDNAYVLNSTGQEKYEDADSIVVSKILENAKSTPLCRLETYLPAGTPYNLLINNQIYDIPTESDYEANLDTLYPEYAKQYFKWKISLFYRDYLKGTEDTSSDDTSKNLTAFYELYNNQCFLGMCQKVTKNYIVIEDANGDIRRYKKSKSFYTKNGEKLLNDVSLVDKCCYSMSMKEFNEKMASDSYAKMSDMTKGKKPWSLHIMDGMQILPMNIRSAADMVTFCKVIYDQLGAYFDQTGFCVYYSPKIADVSDDESSAAIYINTGFESYIENKVSAISDGKVSYTMSKNTPYYYKMYDSSSKTYIDASDNNLENDLIKLAESLGTDAEYTVAVGVDMSKIRDSKIDDEYQQIYTRYEERVKSITAAERYMYIFIVTCIVFVVSLLLLMMSVGYEKGSESIVLFKYDKFGIEIYGSLMVIVIAIAGYALTRYQFYPLVNSILVFIFCMLATCVRKQIKSHTVYEYSLVRKLQINIDNSDKGFYAWCGRRRVVLRKIAASNWYTIKILYSVLVTILTLACIEWAYKYKLSVVDMAGATRIKLLIVMIIILFIADIYAGLRVRHDYKIDSCIINETKQIISGDLKHQVAVPYKTGKNKDELVELINHIGEGLDNAVDESVRNERMKTELITNVSHDIKTPLTSVINYVALIKREHIDNEKVQGYLEVLEHKSDRLKVLIEDLVEASKASSGVLSLEITTLNFNELVKQTNGEFAEKFQQAELDFIADIPKEPVLIMGDGRRVFRVLENLYNNAAKYAMAGTRVYVDLKKEGDMGVFTMKNISACQLNITPQELTERFVRGERSRTTEGSGLGLSIARSLTELMDGTLQIHLDGDLFKIEVSLPVKRVEGESDKYGENKEDI